MRRTNFPISADWLFGSVAWRCHRAASAAASRTERLSLPARRLVETRVAWPLADELRRRGTAARATAVAAVASAAIGAGALGISMGAGGETVERAASEAPPPAFAGIQGSEPTLQGVKPQFKPATTTPPPAPSGEPASPAGRVAWRFAHAFVAYEIGRATKDTAIAFRETAVPALVKSLGTDPPRLPADAKVPKARVLNVVLAERKGREIDASVSLVRLGSISEVRLTLRLQGGGGWRVAEVLG